MDFVLFVGLYKYLNNEISGLTSALMDRSMHWVAAMAYLLFSLWVMFTGYRAITGTLREPLMVVAVNMAKMALIVTTACSMNFFSTDLRQFINNDLGRGINELVTGKPDDIAASIDMILPLFHGHPVKRFNSLSEVNDETEDRRETDPATIQPRIQGASLAQS